VLAGHTLSYAVNLVTGGRLGDHYGRKRIFVVGVAASAACGFAPTQGVFITALLVQGVGSALLFPQTFSTIQVLLPTHKRDRAFAALGVAIRACTVVGRLLGGILVGADIAGLSWRAVFSINLPIGALL
jgi:MFS family permease